MSLTQYCLFINNHVDKAAGRMFNPPPHCEILRTPMGPLLFCYTVHPLLSSLTYDVILGYLDDFTLGSSISSSSSNSLITTLSTAKSYQIVDIKIIEVK